MQDWFVLSLGMGTPKNHWPRRRGTYKLRVGRRPLESRCMSFSTRMFLRASTAPCGHIRKNRALTQRGPGCVVPSPSFPRRRTKVWGEHGGTRVRERRVTKFTAFWGPGSQIGVLNGGLTYPLGPFDGGEEPVMGRRTTGARANGGPGGPCQRQPTVRHRRRAGRRASGIAPMLTNGARRSPSDAGAPGRRRICGADRVEIKIAPC